MTHNWLRLAGIAACVFAASALIACSPTAAPDGITTPTGTAETTTPDSSSATSTSPAATDPTCDGIIPPASVAAYTAAGWTSREEPFQIGGVDLPGGIMCRWADFSTASDNLDYYGWAPITPSQAEKARDVLLRGGGHALEGDGRGAYITDGTPVMVTDDEGYGETYLFGDGWVKVAVTKRLLDTIQSPST